MNRRNGERAMLLGLKSAGIDTEGLDEEIKDQSDDVMGGDVNVGNEHHYHYEGRQSQRDNVPARLKWATAGLIGAGLAGIGGPTVMNYLSSTPPVQTTPDSETRLRITDD